MHPLERADPATQVAGGELVVGLGELREPMPEPVEGGSVEQVVELLLAAALERLRGALGQGAAAERTVARTAAG